MTSPPVLLSLALAWGGVGLLLFAEPARARRAWPTAPRPAAFRWPARALGAGALVLPAWPLGRELGAALGAVAALVLATATLSVATLAFPLWPRLYAASVLGAAVVAAASLGLGA